MLWEQPHPVDWTPEKVQRFWAWVGEYHSEAFFARNYGPHVLEFAEHHRPLTGAEVLDAGAGAGDLAEYLLARGARVTGLEHSTALVASANRRLRGRPGFCGVVCIDDGWDVPPESFDIVFATEVIEHLSDVELENFFTHMREALRPGGLVILTTPNSEDIDARSVMCPDCGGVFHPMQHVRSWTPDSLAHYALTHDIEPIRARVTALHTIGGVSPLGRMKSNLLRLALPKKSNLLFAGRRPHSVRARPNPLRAEVR